MLPIVLDLDNYSRLLALFTRRTLPVSLPMTLELFFLYNSLPNNRTGPRFDLTKLAFRVLSSVLWQPRPRLLAKKNIQNP